MLGDERFETEWTVGKAMSTEEAINYAIAPFPGPPGNANSPGIHSPNE